jgi:hypothetical protein
MPNTNTTTIIVTALLTRDNGHDITPTALKRAASLTDLAGLEIEHDDVIVHDIDDGDVTRVNDWHVAVTYHVVVEAGEDIEGDLLEVVDEALCFMPESGWDMVKSTCRLAR